MAELEFEQQESKLYQAGTAVELKQDQGTVYYVAEYDPMLVPPIWLEDYPKPCYPEELKIVNNLFCLLPQKLLQTA